MAAEVARVAFGNDLLFGPPGYFSRTLSRAFSPSNNFSNEEVVQVLWEAAELI
jgi:hypothetical protein